MAGAPPQTPNAGQSLAIAWRSGYGVEPLLQIIFVSFVSFVAKTTPWLCVKPGSPIHYKYLHVLAYNLRQDYRICRIYRISCFQNFDLIILLILIIL